jgi:hypothetical protein
VSVQAFTGANGTLPTGWSGLQTTAAKSVGIFSNQLLLHYDTAGVSYDQSPSNQAALKAVMASSAAAGTFTGKSVKMAITSHTFTGAGLYLDNGSDTGNWVRGYVISFNGTDAYIGVQSADNNDSNTLVPFSAFPSGVIQLRLLRTTGNVFSVQSSNDGSTWTTRGTITVGSSYNFTREGVWAGYNGGSGGTDWLFDDYDDGLGGASTPPTANAGADTAVASGGTVSLGGTDTAGSSPITSRGWTQISPASPSGSFSAPTAATTNWTAPTVTSSTAFVHRKTVGDGTLSGSDDVTVTVAPPAGASSGAVLVRHNGQWV